MWSPTEHQRMLEGLRLFKRDWAKVTEHVGTRSTAQVRSHAQKYFDKVVREKTDDYVPRARPKRKSAAPYPRKLRQQPTISPHIPNTHNPLTNNTHTATSIPPSAPPHQHPAQPHPVHPHAAHPHASHPHVAHPHAAHPHAYAIPVQQLHPSMAAAHTVQPPTAMHPASMHFQYAAPPSPFMPQFQHSPYMAQARPQIAIQQQPPTPTIFSPYMNICPTQSPNLQQAPNFDSMQPSPVSFVSSHTYAAQSPPQPQHMSVAHPVFNVFSPLTPGAYASAVARSPALAHQPPTSIVPFAHLQQPIAQHPHVHSHPEGPLPNCAKCNALRRYGGVLQEIVQIGGSAPMPTSQVVHPNQSVRWHQPVQHPQQKSSQLCADGSTIKAVNPANDSTVCVTAQEQSASTSGKKSVDDSLPSFKRNGKSTASSPSPAKSRAHRSKLLKSKKMASKLAALRHAAGNVSSGDMSESDNFSRRNLSTDISRPDSREDSSRETIKLTVSSLPTSRKRKSSHNASSGLAGKRQPDSLHRRSKKMKCVPIAPTPVAAARVAKRPRREPIIKSDQSTAVRAKPTAEENDVCRFTQKGKEDKRASSGTSSSDSPKSESESNVGSPRVESYSPKEQKEIFDAVHSLQILSRTPSSSSPSQSESKDDSEMGK
ncbi:unnamed protein product [Agarophyton chilense]